MELKWHIPPKEEVDKWRRGEQPPAAIPAPLPRAGRRRVDATDRAANRQLDAMVGREPVQLPAPRVVDAAASRKPDRYFRVPNEVIDVLLPQLGTAEFAVLLFLLRHTAGWGKGEDAISLGQFARGTHLGRSTVQRALRRLAERGLVRTEGVTSRHGDPDANRYRVLLGCVQNEHTPGQDEQGVCPK